MDLSLHFKYTFYMLFYFFLILYVLFPCVIDMCPYVFMGSCQCRLNSALESRGTGVLTDVIVLAVYVSQINDWLIDWISTNAESLRLITKTKVIVKKNDHLFLHRPSAVSIGDWTCKTLANCIYMQELWTDQWNSFLANFKCLVLNVGLHQRLG